ncbi:MULTISPECIES: hypothetical protein [unclassified Sulfuricurvum]|uniref:hypothetical protein n=1 Tax=unclassified Sulfuricurvum TaxID=2632390 RepID=UPI0002996FCC|nr:MULTISPECIES: hypothetical protein [unclassified Sulfuricurvum]AFV97235.1 hypothetical protein B649_04605 [Candidatus Sulfuricurvum sp. RIFRC-1]HBM34885.1 hypothetical protein [Sulfuricurvum sp.]
MDTESLEQKILADIEKAGFRSEMEVLAKLRSSGLKATGLASYFDLDAEISREYDAEAYLTSIAKNDKEILFNFFYSLCIEVKKSQSPWVIFAEEPIHEFYLSEALNSPCFFAGIEDNVKRAVVNPMQEHSLGKKMGWIGSGIHESFKKPDQPSRWYQALVTACKAAEHNMKANSWPSEGNEHHYPYAFFAKPVVVVDGKLFSAKLDDMGTVNVESIPFASVRFAFSTSKYTRGSYMVDIVSLETLDSYLEIAKDRVNSMYDALQDKLNIKT